jgi:hypothetical protein
MSWSVLGVSAALLGISGRNTMPTNSYLVHNDEIILPLLKVKLSL